MNFKKTAEPSLFGRGLFYGSGKRSIFSGAFGSKIRFLKRDPMEREKVSFRFFPVPA